MNTTLINERKKELKMTNKDLSDITGIPLSTIAKICSGQLKTTSYINLSKLSKVLNCKTSDLQKEVQRPIITEEFKVKSIILERYGSLNRFAEAIGLSPSTVSRILNDGFESATFGKLSLIFSELNLSLDTLVYRKERKYSEEEKNIIDMIDNLNKKGVEKVKEYISDIGMVDKYKKVIVVKGDGYEFHLKKDSKNEVEIIKVPVEEVRINNDNE